MHPRSFLFLHRANIADEDRFNRELERHSDLLAREQAVVCVVYSSREAKCGDLRLAPVMIDAIFHRVLAARRSEAVLIAALGGAELGRWWGGEEILRCAVSALAGEVETNELERSR